MSGHVFVLEIKSPILAGGSAILVRRWVLNSNVGELGAHSLVDLVGIKMKRNVSKL